MAPGGDRGPAHTAPNPAPNPAANAEAISDEAISDEAMGEAITNEKVADLSPRWQQYPGFSLLFDNPGDSLKPSGSHQLLATSRSVPFYRRLYDAVATSRLSDIRAFCMLPFGSLHVTALDGLNAGNVGGAAPSIRERARDYITRLPHSLGERPSFVEPLRTSKLTGRSWALELKVEDLVVWSESVLAARLRPTSGGQPAFERFKRTRRALRHSYADRFGVAVRTPYVPHVTLGYFANRPAARRARRLFGDELNAIARAAYKERLPLSRVRLYAFTDMATFMCAR